MCNCINFDKGCIEMNKPHKHAELIKAWADGAEIEFFENVCHAWLDCTKNKPTWDDSTSYRIKEKRLRDYEVETAAAMVFSEGTLQPCVAFVYGKTYNLKLIFDRHTHELKSAEVLK